MTTRTFNRVVPAGPVGADMVASVGPGWDDDLDRLGSALGGSDPGRITFEPHLERSEQDRELIA